MCDRMWLMPSRSAPATFTTVHALNSGQRERRARLSAAARELASEGGYAAVTMHAVADRSRVARATVYRYFGSKDQLLTAVGAEWAREVTGESATAEYGGAAADAVTRPAERMAGLLAEIIERTARDLPLAAAVVSAVISGDPTADRERRALYDIVLGRLDGTIGNAVATEDRAEIVHLLGQLLLAAFTGLCLLHQSLEQVRAMLTGAAHRLLP